MAGIAFDSAGTLNGAVGSVLTWTHTVGAGNASIIFAYVFDGGTSTPPGAGSMKYAGTAMTLLKSGTQTGDPISAQWYYLLNPPVGLGTFHGTYSGTPSGGEYDALSVSYIGVNQVTPFAGSSISIGTNNSTGGSVTRAIQGADWWAGLIIYDNNTGVTAIGNQRGTAGNGAMVLGGDSTGGTLRWTNPNTASNFVAIGAELVASAGLIQSSGTAVLGLGSTSAVWSQNTVNGNLVVVGVTLTNAATLGTVTSITDTQGNTYNKAVSGTKSSSLVSVIDEEIWYAANIVGGAGSVTVNHTIDNCGMYVREYNGWNTLDGTQSAIGSSATPNTGTVNTNFGTELLVVSTGDDKGVTQTWTAAGKYADMVGTATTLTGISMEDALQLGTAAQTGTLTLGATADWVALFASFSQASGTVSQLPGFLSLLGVGRT